jgi:hypothetical protein
VEIAIGAPVLCADGLCGHSTYAIVDPITEKMTHLVVKTGVTAAGERLVPTGAIERSTAEGTQLRCSKDELQAMEAFIEYRYDSGYEPFGMYEADQYLLWPHSLLEGPEITEHESVPPGEFVIERGSTVQARDGQAGQVDELLVDGESGRITHLVMRKGHLWGQRDVTISVSAVDRIEDDTVYLKLRKQDISALPALPLRRPRLRR